MRTLGLTLLSLESEEVSSHEKTCLASFNLLVQTQRIESIKKAVPDCMRRKDMLITREGNLLTLINVFETTPEKQQALIDQWVRFTEEVRNEPGYLGTALHKSADGTRVINYAHWRSQADFDAFLKRHRADFAQFGQNASRMDPHTYDIVYLDEPGRN